MKFFVYLFILLRKNVNIVFEGKIIKVYVINIGVLFIFMMVNIYFLLKFLFCFIVENYIGLWLIVICLV